jgi:quercetin dioxygenase-like cupin family protein
MTHHVLAKLVSHSGTGPTKSVFFEEGRLKAQVMGLEPGQRIPPCSMDFDVAFVVLEGEGEIIIDGERESVRPSSWIFVSKESRTRSIEARTKMTVLATQFR